MGRGVFRSARRTVWVGTLFVLVSLACRVQVIGPAAPPPTVFEPSTPGGGSTPAAASHDTTPPTLVQVRSPAEIYYGGSCGAPSLLVQVRVQDDAGPPAQVWLEYAYGEARQTRQISFSPTGGDGYLAQIPVGQEAPRALPQGGALYYRVWAADAAGNRSAAPGPSTWFTVSVLACAGEPASGSSAAAQPPFAPANPGSPGTNPNAPATPGGTKPQPGAPAAPNPPNAPGGAAPNPPSSNAPSAPNPPSSAPPQAPNAPDAPAAPDPDLPQACDPSCDADNPDVAELPPDAQPADPPGFVVIDPNDIGGNAPGGDNPAAPPDQPAPQPGGNNNPAPPAEPGVVRIVNQSSFPIVSLQFLYDDPQTGQRKQEEVILAPNQVIPSNGGFNEVYDLIPGVVYSVMPGIGFWDANGRTVTGYLAPQIVQVGPGEKAVITITNPSVQELVTQFGTVNRYKGFTMGGSPVASYCVYLDLNGNQYTLTILHESGQTVLNDSGTFHDTYISERLGFISLQFNGNQTSFEGNYAFKGPEIGTLKLMNVYIPSQGFTLPFIELMKNSSLCP